MRYFTSTNSNLPSENRKAIIKNHNLPILNWIYHGNENTEIHCCLTKTPGFTDVYCPVRKRTVQVFRIDFDHIRQKYDSYRKATGKSIDKTYTPSGIFRDYKLDSPAYKDKLVEMMTCWPLCTEYHSYKSSSSQHGNIILNDYPKKLWPWHLKNKTNFNKVCKRFELDLDYDWFIEQLNNVDAECIPDSYRRSLRRVFDGLFVEEGFALSA